MTHTINWFEIPTTDLERASRFYQDVLGATLKHAHDAATSGSVVLPKTDIGESGFIALVRDTEGNVVGLHAPR